MAVGSRASPKQHLDARSLHVSDLATTDWFGLITGVFVAGEFDIHVMRNNSERVFYVGGKSNTILFKYEICKMDKNGSVYETVSRFPLNRELPTSNTMKLTILSIQSVTGMECKWLPVVERNINKLPVTEFVNHSTRVDQSKVSSISSNESQKSNDS